MSTRSRNVMQAMFVVACCAILLISSGCSFCRPSSVCDTDEKFNAKGIGIKLGRGLTNAAFCWLEVPHEMESRVRGNRGETKAAWVFTLIDIPIGIAWGGMNTVDRAVNAVFEVATFPLPPYGPNSVPAWPAYFGDKHGAERGNGLYSSESDFTSLWEDAAVCCGGCGKGAKAEEKE